ERISEFNALDSFAVFLAVKQTVDVGVNLFSANHLVLVEPWWNPAVDRQSIDRIYRLG
ncbi:MAG: hypothetical protein MHM6MM_007083, partial [Cercozoa sp. M6MM]